MENMSINLIGISGRIGSGKDTIGSIIQNQLPDGDWQIKKFAGKLKQIAGILTGIPVERFEDQEFKKTKLGKEWDRMMYNGDPFGKPEQFDVFHESMTVRTLLQRLGTEALRDGLHQNVWVNALFAEYLPMDLEQRCSMGDVIDYSRCRFPNWIITDVRFPNEAKAIRDRGGIIIRIDRPELKTIARQHPSETALDHYEFDHVICNDGDLMDLIDKTKDFLKTKGFAVPSLYL